MGMMGGTSNRRRAKNNGRQADTADPAGSSGALLTSDSDPPPHLSPHASSHHYYFLLLIRIWPLNFARLLHLALREKLRLLLNERNLFSLSLKKEKKRKALPHMNHSGL